MMKSVVIAAVMGLALLSSPRGWAEDGPMAEVQLGADVVTRLPWPMGGVLVGWRLSDRWSAGVSYWPLRLVFQDMKTANDVIAAPIMLSGLHAVGDFWYRTGSAWGGKAGIQLGALMPYLWHCGARGRHVGGCGGGTAVGLLGLHGDLPQLPGVRQGGMEKGATGEQHARAADGWIRASDCGPGGRVRPDIHGRAGSLSVAVTPVMASLPPILPGTHPWVVLLDVSEHEQPQGRVVSRKTVSSR